MSERASGAAYNGRGPTPAPAGPEVWLMANTDEVAYERPGWPCKQIYVSQDAPDPDNELDRGVSASECPPVPRTLNLFGWSAVMIRQLLASGMRFSYFVLKCILVSRGDRDEPLAALFPLPFPRDDVWDSGLKKLGSTRRARLAERRALFLAVELCTICISGTSSLS